eukprot:NODE_1042_length_2489_cov_0.626778.p2 type:complete len:146 gc:universal NODE_1042_length_2489_cov_0.626778:574-137(-)
MDLSKLLNRPQPGSTYLSLHESIYKTSTFKKERKVLKDSDSELENLFHEHNGLVPSPLITQLSRERQMEREHVRIWFHNRRMKERQILLRKYKSTKLKLLSNLNSNMDLSKSRNVMNQWSHLLEETCQIMKTVNTFELGNYATEQ